jgi:hypothetical protein
MVSSVRKPITMRFDPDLLARARLHAALENRTLTNFIETAVLQRLSGPWPPAGPMDAPAAGPAAAAASPAEQDR